MRLLSLRKRRNMREIYVNFHCNFRVSTIEIRFASESMIFMVTKIRVFFYGNPREKLSVYISPLASQCVLKRLEKHWLTNVVAGYRYVFKTLETLVAVRVYEWGKGWQIVEMLPAMDGRRRKFCIRKCPKTPKTNLFVSNYERKQSIIKNTSTQIVPSSEMVFLICICL